MNNSSQLYVPINCSFYDYLEEAAPLDKKAIIEYLNNNNVVKIEAKIKTFEINDKIEYMVLDTGRSIRLDNLISFNERVLPNSY